MTKIKHAINRLWNSTSAAVWRCFHRLVRHWQVAGKRGSFVCVRGLAHDCVIRGIIYNSPFHAELAYRIDYTIADTGREVINAEISTESFMPNARVQTPPTTTKNDER